MPISKIITGAVLAAGASKPIQDLKKQHNKAWRDVKKHYKRRKPLHNSRGRSR